MRSISFSFLGLLLSAGLVLVATGLRVDAQEKTDEQARVDKSEKLFALTIQPLFRKKCWACHGENREEIEGGFNLSDRENLLKGGESFGDEVLVPGKSKNSILLQMVLRHVDVPAMPPKLAEKLTQEEVWAVRDWIDGGAPWPNPERVQFIYRKFAQGVTWPTSGGLSEEWTRRKYDSENLWSFAAVDGKRSSIRELLKRAKDGVNPIDHFIDRKLAKAKLEPAPSTDRRTLIRRAKFDLLGLPPTPSEVQEFLEDDRSDQLAFAALVDRFLESPRYGEQQATHWLDVTRYADSSGFANDWERPNAWRYRDYVIRSFNQDKPYDQFVKEQIAGDEIASDLDDPSPKTNPGAAELMIATGFLRMGPWEHTGMSVAKVTRQQFLDDITDAVGQVFMGHALQCCRCHDHKFDPIPTRDYYSIQAVFATTQFGDIDTLWLPDENRDLMGEDKRFKLKKLAANRELSGRINKRNQEYIKRWFKEQGLEYENVAQAKKAGVPVEKLPPRRVYWSPDDYGQDRIARKWSTKLQWEMDRYRPIAFAVYSGKTEWVKGTRQRIQPPRNGQGKGKVEETAILKGGDVHAPTQIVDPAVLSAARLPWTVPKSIKGRRLAFARWLTSPKNPLTARVMVNRIWQNHFGRGIAGNANNFGSTGKKPTHPLLLDWLAEEFVSRGWSIKQLHRLIMNSRAYQRSVKHPDAENQHRLDPNGELYASFVPRRLTAEELRDSMLFVSGELNSAAGGIPCKPDMNLEAALQPRMIMGTFAPSYVPHPKPEQRNRRSIYVTRLRGQRDPFFETFNQPSPEKSCELRDRSMVTPQALTLLNSDEAYDRALALANRALRKAKGNRKLALQRLFQLVYTRPPTDSEWKFSNQFWSEMTARHEKIKFQPVVYPKSVTRTANEENTGKPFSFVERLFEFEEYQPDLQASEVDAATRGLADICLALLNSNEFVLVE